jgi:hypothetical protein
MTNPALERAVAAAVLAVDAEAVARRAHQASERRSVTGTPLPEAMGRLEIETGQEIVAAILGDLDSLVASAKAAGDTRRPDQIRCDELVHRMTFGAFGAPAVRPSTPAGPGRSGEPGESDPPAGPGASGEPAGPTSSYDSPDSPCPSHPEPVRYGRWGRRGMHVGLTMPLSTWLGLAEEPGLLDGYGPIAAALARQIAADAARDHPVHDVVAVRRRGRPTPHSARRRGPDPDTQTRSAAPTRPADRGRRAPVRVPLVLRPRMAL